MDNPPTSTERTRPGSQPQQPTNWVLLATVLAIATAVLVVIAIG